MTIMGSIRGAQRARSGASGRSRGAAGAAALVWAAVLAASAIAASTDFVERRTSPEPVGPGPADLVAADLDGDLDSDLAVADSLIDAVTILHGNGLGNFGERANSPEAVGEGPVSLAAADFDGDSDLDLATANADSRNVTILHNNGVGNFGERANSPERVGPGNPSAIAAADLDGDSDQDLAVSNRATNDVTIHLNNGVGNFHRPDWSPEPVGNGPSSIAAADLDGDSDQDLAVAHEELPDAVTILLNDGSGDFHDGPGSPIAAGRSLLALASADLDGDSDVDLAVADDFSDVVRILLNDGSGGFAEPPSSPEPIGHGPMDVVVADFDRDADGDLAVVRCCLLGDQDVAVLANDGQGDFAEAGTGPESAGRSPTDLVVARFDGDLDDDLAVANLDSDDVTILLNR